MFNLKITTTAGKSVTVEVDSNCRPRLEQYFASLHPRSVIVPKGVTEIEECAFQGCTSLASIALPETVTTIGVYAFYGCASLAAITFPEGLTTIGYGAFDGCTSLAAIAIPEGVTTIERDVFARCTSLASINLPAGLTAIKKYAFVGCSSLVSINLPGGLTTIGGSAFAGCTSLASIVIPETVDTIGRGFCFRCDSLIAVNLPRRLSSVSRSNLISYAEHESIKVLVMPYETTDGNELGMSFARTFAPNAVLVVFKHNDGRIEVVPGPAAAFRPAIVEPTVNIVMLNKTARTSWIAALANQQRRQKETVMALQRFGQKYRINLDPVVLLAILEFVYGNSSLIDRLVRSRMQKAIKPRGNFYNWAEMDTSGKAE
jgi:hypothetical protein